MSSMQSRSGSRRVQPGSTQGILGHQHKPHYTFGTRLKHATNACIVGVFNIFEGNGYSGGVARWSAVLLLGSLTAAAAVGAWLCARDLHVRFWLGQVPQLALAALAVSLALTLFTLCYKSWIYGHRQHQRMLRRHGAKGNLDPACLLSSRVLRSIFFLLAFFSFGSLGLSIQMIHFGRQMSSVLSGRCGHSGTTHAIEHIHEKLRVFRNQCHKSRMDRSKPVDQCPGYSSSFPPPAPYATYLKLLELESGCSGFCSRGHGTLFARPGSTTTRGHQTCAAYLGGYIRMASLVVAGPAAGLSACLMLFGIALLLYDDL